MSEISSDQHQPPGDAVDIRAPSSATRSGLRTAWWWLLAIIGLAGVLSYRTVATGIRRQVAKYHADVATQALLQGDSPAALHAVNDALAWLPDDGALLYLRGQIHAEVHDWNASLADFNRVTQTLAPEFAPAYQQRAAIHAERGDWDKALADLDHAVRCAPSEDPNLLNHRAYTRALANIDLPEALDDIETALRFVSRRTQQAGVDRPPPAALVDTLGYVHYRLGNHEQALTEIERALGLLEEQRSALREMLVRRKKPVAPAMKEYDKVEGEMVYHRALVRAALSDEQAAADFALAKQLGYEAPE